MVYLSHPGMLVPIQCVQYAKYNVCVILSLLSSPINQLANNKKYTLPSSPVSLPFTTSTNVSIIFTFNVVFLKY